MRPSNRREFLKYGVGLGVAMATAKEPFSQALAATGDKPGSDMRFGFVTYLWGQHWKLPTLIENCEKSGLLGVELRVQHAHGVDPSLNAEERKEVRKRFEDSPVTPLGMGTNEHYDSPDPKELKKCIDRTKEFVRLSHDIGGSGVKVKPNNLPKGVSEEKTIRQIGESLNEVGRYGAEYGQQIRLEVHGQCAPLPIIHKIMEVATHPNVGVCWNCNEQDLEGKGLKYNFNLVKDRFGDTAHVRELNIGSYPYQELMNLFVAMDYDGWILLEARTDPEDKVKAMIEQRNVWEDMVRKARNNLNKKS